MVSPDPITIQIVRNRISSLMEEMDYRFYRSGYSTIVRESRDFSCVITDGRGRLIIPPPMFFHGPVYFHLIQRILKLFGADGLDDGDTLVCNHPYEGNLPHLPDMALVTPVCFDGTLVAFAASIAHNAAMGGAVLRRLDDRVWPVDVVPTVTGRLHPRGHGGPGEHDRTQHHRAARYAR